jgi:uncharacterized protein with HEPN domain
MTVETIIRTISLILAPVVMVSSCVLFLNGVLQRYSAITDRMRAMHLERLEILRMTADSVSGALENLGALNSIRVHEIEEQLPHLLWRHKMIHRAALVVDFAVLTFVACMFIIALAALMNSGLVATIALLCFLLGTAALLVGVILKTVEFYQSYREVMFEVMHGLGLGKKDVTARLK